MEWKLIRLNNEVRNQTFIQAPGAVIFGCWPLAQQYASYVVALAWIGVAFILTALVYSVFPESSTATASSPSSGTARAVEGRLHVAGSFSLTRPSIDINASIPKSSFT